MTIIKIIDTFTFYGLDVVALSVATCIVVQILKNTLFKRFNKKVRTFLPFIVGAILYACYAAVCELSFSYILDNFSLILEHGFAVGMLSTVLYVWYEQFVRENKNLSPAEGVISTLIEGYVPSDEVEATAKAIAEAISKDVLGDGAAKTAEILSSSTNEGITERDIKLLSKLIIETLAHLNTI